MANYTVRLDNVTGPDVVSLGDGTTYATLTVNANSRTPLVADPSPELGGDLSTNGHDVLFGDNDKAIFGAGSDLQIYSDGNASWIDESGSGTLNIRTNGASIRLYDTANSVDMIRAYTGGSVRLFNDGDQKLTTTSTGVDVTGTVTADGLTVDGVTSLSDADTTAIASIEHLDPTASEFEFYNTDNSAAYSGLRLRTRSAGASSWLMANEWSASYKGDLVFRSRDGATSINQKLRLSNNGDISFYEDTGTTPKFFWDASAEALGIGTSSPDNLMTLQTSTYANAYVPVANIRYNANDVLKFGFTGSAGSIRTGTIDTGIYGLAVNTGDGTERMRIDSSGNLLIGYTSSNGSYKLQVNSQIFATSSTIATSDGRYKENVTPLTGALDLVSALNPVHFDWKSHSVHDFDTENTTIGFIAQEVEDVLADKPYLGSIVKSNTCVITPEETDEDGNVIAEAVTEEFLGIAEGNLVALLTKAIQEQKAIIDALETRITALEG